jgi:hypothetical protein
MNNDEHDIAIRCMVMTCPRAMKSILQKKVIAGSRTLTLRTTLLKPAF